MDGEQYLVVTSRSQPLTYDEAKILAERFALREGTGHAHVVQIVATVTYSPEWKEAK